LGCIPLLRRPDDGDAADDPPVRRFHHPEALPRRVVVPGEPGEPLGDVPLKAVVEALLAGVQEPVQPNDRAQVAGPQIAAQV